MVYSCSYFKDVKCKYNVYILSMSIASYCRLLEDLTKYMHILIFSGLLKNLGCRMFLRLIFASLTFILTDHRNLDRMVAVGVKF